MFYTVEKEVHEVRFRIVLPVTRSCFESYVQNNDWPQLRFCHDRELFETNIDLNGVRVDALAVELVYLFPTAESKLRNSEIGLDPAKLWHDNSIHDQSPVFDKHQLLTATHKFASVLGRGLQLDSFFIAHEGKRRVYKKVQLSP